MKFGRHRVKYQTPPTAPAISRRAISPLNRPPPPVDGLEPEDPDRLVLAMDPERAVAGPAPDEAGAVEPRDPAQRVAVERDQEGQFARRQRQHLAGGAGGEQDQPGIRQLDPGALDERVEAAPPQDAAARDRHAAVDVGAR